jgi:hypothetical protein
MSMIDVFDDEAWQFRNIVAAINKPPYTPQQITSMGLFDWRPQDTDKISVELMAGTQTLLVETSRHGNPTEVIDDKAAAVPLQIRAHKQHATVWADEVLGRRQWGTDAVRKSIQSVRDARTAKARRNFDLTREFRYAGAIRGKILHPVTASVLYNFYTIFGITPPSTVFLDLGASSGGVLMDKLDTARGVVLVPLGGTVPSGWRAICGRTFWSAFVKNVEVRESFDRFRDSEFFRTGHVFSGFTWGGIEFEPYRNPGSPFADFVTDDQAILLPTGVPDMFLEAGAPAPWFDAVENPALPFYAMATVDPKRRFMEIDMESHTLPINTRPDAIRILDKDAS